MLVWHGQSWCGNGHTCHTAFSTHVWRSKVVKYTKVVYLTTFEFDWLNHLCTFQQQHITNGYCFQKSIDEKGMEDRNGRQIF